MRVSVSVCENGEKGGRERKGEGFGGWVIDTEWVAPLRWRGYGCSARLRCYQGS